MDYENLSLEEIDAEIQRLNAHLKQLEESKGRLGFSFAASVTLGRVEDAQHNARNSLRRLEKIKEQKLKQQNACTNQPGSASDSVETPSEPTPEQ